LTHVIPLISTTSTFRQTVTLDGSEYVFVFRWNTRACFWYVSLLDADGVALTVGRKLVADKPLFQRDVDERLPPGDLWVISGGVDPGLRDLGGSAALLYVEAET
jgi:hypothetical protein